MKSKANCPISPAFGIKRIKTNTQLNPINNNILLYQNNNKFNKRLNNNSIKLVNLTFNKNKFLSLYNNINYNNIYFIKRNPRISKINTANNSTLNINNNSEIKLLSHYKSINDLKLKGNIIYKSKFKNNLTEKIV